LLARLWQNSCSCHHEGFGNDCNDTVITQLNLKSNQTKIHMTSANGVMM